MSVTASRWIKQRTMLRLWFTGRVEGKGKWENFNPSVPALFNGLPRFVSEFANSSKIRLPNQKKAKRREKKKHASEAPSIQK